MESNDTKRAGWPRDFIERVLEATDSVTFFGRYTSLRKSGNRYVGLCPLHKEKTPSFTIDPDRGLFYCFGCGKGGDILAFLMEKEALSFSEAVQFLAKKAGIPLPAVRQKSSAISAMQQAIEIAQEFYKKMLFSSDGSSGLEYLAKRGIDASFAEKFGFGWAPPQWDALARYVDRKGLDVEPFLKTGLLALNKERKTIYDCFRHGVMIPIRNSAGRQVAFAIRSLDESGGPKYINSHESPIYRKSEVLFGLDYARKAIRQEQFAILVEGYFDVISLWRSGVEHAVASCGTAFNESHANNLAKFCETVVIFYDGDDAGLTATYRAIPPLLKQELMVKIARPPDKMDPDDFARSYPPEQVKQRILEAKDWLDFSAEMAQSAGLFNSVEGKMRFVNKVSPYILSLRRGLTAALYRKKLAEILDVSEKEIADRMRGFEKKMGTPSDLANASSMATKEFQQEALLELEILAFMIINPLLRECVINSDDIILYRGALERISEEIIEKGRCAISALSDILEPKAMSYLCQILMKQKTIPPESCLLQIQNTLRVVRLKQEQSKLKMRLREAQSGGDEKEIRKYLAEISEIQLKINAIISNPIRKGN